MLDRARGRLRRIVGRYVVPRGRYDELMRVHKEMTRLHGQWVPPGHFYSPFPDLDDLDARSEAIFGQSERPAAVELREGAQLALFDTVAELAEEAPFPAEQGDEFRYFFGNPAYAWGDGLVLHALLRHNRPRRIVEVGSGYSSALILDTVDGWLSTGTEVVFVEPYPELLRSLLRPGDERRVSIHEQPVQEVPLETFTSLGPGDLLFIDSTHVVKAGSDVNRLFFDVLPCLAEGVWIHFHDIFFPFEYPEPWVREGRAWQEIYLLRAFLMFNPAFEIRWFQSFMWAQHRQLLEERLPLIAKNPGGNVWLQRVGG
jgi:predicted O-methyltransferase YrrM